MNRISICIACMMILCGCGMKSSESGGEKAFYMDPDEACSLAFSGTSKVVWQQDEAFLQLNSGRLYDLGKECSATLKETNGGAYTPGEDPFPGSQ